MPSRPPFSFWSKKLEDSGCATRWAPGSIRLPIAPRCAHVWPWRTGAGMNMVRRVLRNEAQIEVHDDLAGVLHEEIERLPERFRSPLILCDLEGRSHEQAARHLGWPVGTVKSRQSRGRERLRDRLRRRGLAPDAGVLCCVAAAGWSICAGFLRPRRFHNPVGISACLVPRVHPRFRRFTRPGSFEFHEFRSLVEIGFGAPFPWCDHFRSRLAGPEGNAGRSAAGCGKSPGRTR